MELTSLQTILFIFLVSLYLYIFFLRPKSKKTTLMASESSRSSAASPISSATATASLTGALVSSLAAPPTPPYSAALERILLTDFLGKGIFNTDGELWRIQRKTASYEFNTKSLRNFVMENVYVELHTRLIPILESAARTDRVLDVQDILERFAFDNICKVAFNVDPGCLGGDGTAGGEFMQAFEDAATLSSVHEFADKIIRTRLEEKAEKKDEDLLSRFIANSENSAEFLRDIVISFILAGRDTTSAALSWFFWLLSTRPDVEERILQELENIRRQNGKSIGEIYSFDELREMHYLHAAISEAMRLYPPVPVDTKACKDDDILPDGTVIGKNWFISYHTYAMGRMESIWGEDCCEFKPERWIENGICKQESPFKYPVFHAGPRMCLGKDMAYIQMKSIAASVLERFGMDVLLENGKSPEPLLSLTLRMKGGLPVRVKERLVRA
ncbi:UNVERIFIED_CONTAM: cytochrome [Sesamum radiatum]|uniref:Cytochrome n=1 Tax=Sesamum radiatum TaxID=300843 RepID=A0AAW2TIQ7_SESRA